MNKRNGNDLGSSALNAKNMGIKEDLGGGEGIAKRVLEKNGEICHVSSSMAAKNKYSTLDTQLSSLLVSGGSRLEQIPFTTLVSHHHQLQFPLEESPYTSFNACGLTNAPFLGPTREKFSLICPWLDTVITSSEFFMTTEQLPNMQQHPSSNHCYLFPASVGNDSGMKCASLYFRGKVALISGSLLFPFGFNPSPP